MLSESAKDSIRAVVYMAIHTEEKKFISIKEIANNLGLPFYFLSKNMLKLVKAGLIESLRGPKGGVKFKKSLEEIKLIDVVAAIDGVSMFEKCALGFKDCDDKNPCVVHHRWSKEKHRLYDMFNVSVGSIVREIKSGKVQNVKL